MMTENEMKIYELADAADMIVNGYAFTKFDDKVRVINLNHLDSVAIINSDDKIIETTMCDIEMEIVKDIYSLDKQFLED